MRIFISGSAPLQTQTFESFEKGTGHRILERYGMSEAGIICSNPYDPNMRLPGTVGYLLPNTQGRVVNSEGTKTHDSEIGELQIKGPSVIHEYWNRQKETNQSFTKDGYFKTGDLAQRSSSGRISIVGRSKDLVISGGLNVYPKEIELIINQLPGISESAVVGIADEDFGEKVVAVIVIENNFTLSEDQIKLELEQHLTKYKIPKRIWIWESLPRNTMGKVQKHIIRKKLSS